MKSFRFLLFALILISGKLISAQDSVRNYQQLMINADTKGSPVILLGDTLFKIRVPFGAFSAEDRAKALSSRLFDVVKEEFYYPDSLGSFIVDGNYYVMYRNRILLTIQPADTVMTGMNQEQIAQIIVSELNRHLASKSEQFNFLATVKNIGYTALVALLLVVIIIFLNWLFRKIISFVEKRKERLFKSISINTYEFLTADREYRIAVSFLKVVKISLIIILFLIALPLIFSIFPSTEGLTRKLLGMVWSPVKDILMALVNYLPKLITIIIIYFIFKYLIRFFRFLSKEVENNSLVIPGFHSDWAKPTFNIIRVLLYAFMFVIIFPYLPGSDSPIFKGVSVFLGVLISLGSTSLVGNTIAGLVITYMRPYKVGDRIKIDDIIGTVTEKTLMVTRIRTIKNEEVTIPNSKVLSGHTTNYTSPTEGEGLIIHTTVTIGYDAPWRQVHELLVRAAEKTEGVVKEPKPFVLQTSLDDFYISYQINAFIKNANGIIRIKSDLHQNIQDEFNRAGVEIMSPHYRAERDGNAPAMPARGEESKTGGL